MIARSQLPDANQQIDIGVKIILILTMLVGLK